MIYIRGFFIVTLLSFAILGCSQQKSLEKPAAKAAKEVDNTLYLGSVSEPKTFNVFVSTDAASSRINEYLFWGVTVIDGLTGEAKPGLAERWEFSENGLMWTFHLREGLRWSDGAAFTTDDVLFTVNDIIYNPDVITSLRDIFTVDGQQFEFTKVDDTTFTVNTGSPFAPFLRLMSFPIYPKHKLEDAVRNKTFMQAWASNVDPREIVGTGPFVFTQYEPGVKMVFERNPYFWKQDEEGNKLPYIDRMVITLVGNTNTLLLKFWAGETDAVVVLGKDYAFAKAKEEEGNYTVHECGPNFGSTILWINQSKAMLKEERGVWFRDRSFRQAIAYCIDKQTIIDNVFYGKAFPQHAFMGEAARFFYNREVQQYAFDLEKAKELFAGAGYQDIDGDGIIEKPEGVPVRCVLLTNAGVPELEEIASIMVSDLRKVGIDALMRTIDFNNLITKTSYTGDWDMVLLNLTGSREPHFGKNVYTSTGRMHLWNVVPASPAGPKDQDTSSDPSWQKKMEAYKKKHQQWEEGLRDWEKELDVLFSSGVQELDMQERKKLYDRAQEIVADEVPIIFTAQVQVIYAVRNRFDNLQPTAYGGIFHNIEEIKIKE